MEKRLLIIDDNPEIVEIVTVILTGLFEIIHSAASVEKAETLLANNSYQLVVLDINLEGRNGAEIIKYLIDAETNPNKNSPFLILSGIITPHFIERNKDRFAGILQKPFEHDELKKMAESILGVPPSEKMDSPKEESLPGGEIPYIKCELPFPIAQLEQRVNKIMDSVKKNAKLKLLFSKMIIDRNADTYILTHIGMLINISTAICTELEWNTDKTLEKFVYAAYLHDMALSGRPDLARINTLVELELKKETLSAADYKLIFEHPNMAANSVEGMIEIPADVAMIIRQHHEMPKENGFPTKCGFQKIVPLSVVFIIAHDLTEYILQNPKWTLEEYCKKARSRFKGAHFSKVLHSMAGIK